MENLWYIPYEGYCRMYVINRIAPDRPAMKEHKGSITGRSVFRVRVQSGSPSLGTS